MPRSKQISLRDLITIFYLIVYCSAHVAKSETDKFSAELEKVFSTDCTDCCDEIEKNFLIDNSTREFSGDRIVDYQRCETFDSIAACKCDFFDKILTFCHCEQENLWYLQALKEESCKEADDEAIAEDQAVQEFIESWGISIRMQDNRGQQHVGETKYIEVNKPGTHLNAERTSSDDNELNWNSYDAENNVGPAVEINGYVTFEDSSTIDSLDKRGLPHMSDIAKKRIEKELRKQNSEKQRIHQAAIPRVVPMDHIKVTGLSSGSKEVLTVTSTRELWTQSTSTITTYIVPDTIVADEEEINIKSMDPDEFASTTTLEIVANKTQQILQIVYATAADFEVKMAEAEATTTTAELDETQSTTVASESPARIREGMMSITSPTRIREGMTVPNTAEPSVINYADARSRNGNYHQKALAKSNLKYRKRNIETEGEEDIVPNSGSKLYRLRRSTIIFTFMVFVIFFQ